MNAEIPVSDTAKERVCLGRAEEHHALDGNSEPDNSDGRRLRHGLAVDTFLQFWHETPLTGFGV